MAGTVAIQCNVTAQAAVNGCVILSEDPPNLGFGDAALKMAASFQMTPKTVDGKPVDGGSFATRIRFNYDGETQWVRRPTEDELLAAWPEGARGVPGRVVMNCDTDSKGHVFLCQVTRETPTGLGFGAAAMKLSPGFVLTPASDPDVQFAVDFVLPASK